MSNNYYLIKRCGSCGHIERVHIGKASSGWAFALHVEPDEPAFPSTLSDWEDRLAASAADGWSIVCEYGDAYTAIEMVSLIRLRPFNGSLKRYPTADRYFVDALIDGVDLVSGSFS